MKRHSGTVAVVGAGFSGAVLANELARNQYKVEVYESRSHVAGNCFTSRNDQTGIMVHSYGPHIFHTNSIDVWNYISQYDEFMPFTNRVKAHSGGRVYSLPVNLLTINQFFNTQLSPAKAQQLIESLGDKTIETPKNFEEQALRFLGKALYEAFFMGYTKKQWGVEPTQLPASILKRLPLRFNYDDNYYSSRFQGMPRHGYTHIVQQLLSHDAISVSLNTTFSRDRKTNYDHIFYTGPLDAWFEYCEGRLGYRTLDFETEVHAGDFQGNAVINYCDESVPFTRIAEHKHFSPWEAHEMTVVTKEYSRFCTDADTPYYPLRLVNDKSTLAQYVSRAKAETGVTFLGRLGTYRYLDMDVTIMEALKTATVFLAAASQDRPCQSFIVDPLAQ